MKLFDTYEYPTSHIRYSIKNIDGHHTVLTTPKELFIRYSTQLATLKEFNKSLLKNSLLVI